MGLGAAAETLGLMLIYSSVYTILLSLIGIGISLVSRTSRVPYYLGMGSIVFIVLTGLLMLTSATCMAFVFLVPSAIFTYVNQLLWGNRHRNPEEPVSDVESRRGAVWIAGSVFLLNLFLSCGAMYPVMFIASHVTHGRGPVKVNRADVVQGMTMDEIRERYGEPHMKGKSNRGPTWYYNGGFTGYMISIDFDADNRVLDTWICD